jgi:hypothetical protein
MQPRYDANAAEAAQQVQAHARTWLVMWSPWHRRFDAWEYSDPKCCRTVQAPTAGELWDRIQVAELDLWLARPPRDLPLMSPMASHKGQPLLLAPGPIPGPNGPSPADSGFVPGPHPPRKKGTHRATAFRDTGK